MKGLSDEGTDYPCSIDLCWLAPIKPVSVCIRMFAPLASAPFTMENDMKRRTILLR
jgi:hypothetical protein